MKKFLFIHLVFVVAISSQSLFGMLDALKASGQSNFNTQKFVIEFRLGTKCFDAGDYRNAQILFERVARNPACPPSMQPSLQLRLACIMKPTKPSLAQASCQDIVMNPLSSSVTSDAALGLLKRISKDALQSKNYPEALQGFTFITRSPRAYPKIIASSHLYLAEIAAAQNKMQEVYQRTSIILRMYGKQKISERVVLQALSTQHNVGCAELRDGDNGCETTFKSILEHTYMKTVPFYSSPYGQERVLLEAKTLRSLAEFYIIRRRRTAAAECTKKSRKN